MRGQDDFHTDLRFTAWIGKGPAKKRCLEPFLCPGSFYTLVEPTFLSALGIELNQPVEVIDVAGVGGRRRLSCFVLERLHSFGALLADVRVLALEFSGILPSIHGVSGLRDLRACQATLDLVRNVVTTP